VLHGHPFHLPPANDLTDELWTRSQQASDLGPGARVLDPADALLQTCARAASDLGRGSLHWVTDCWYLLPRQPELDWELLVRTATAGQLALPLFVMLDYLRASLWAPIPLEALRGLADAARSAPPLAREAALYGARLDRQRGTIRALLRRSTHWRSRALIVRWLLLPSPAYLDWLEPLDRSWQLPLRYLRRPARYVVRRLVAG
jgi:hypothetical protein